MQVTNSEKIVCGASFILSIITYFVLICFLDEKTTICMSALMFFVHIYLGLYIVRKYKLILEIRSSVLDKDIKQSQNIGFLGFKSKTEAYAENLLLNISKS